jgi:hypothetical protein
MSRTYRAMAHSYRTCSQSYQDIMYHDNVMPREHVRELYRRLLRGEIKDENPTHRLRWYTLHDLVKHAHKTVFRNRCSYRQRMHAIALYKRYDIKAKRAKLKQELARQFDQWPFVEGPEEDFDGVSIALNDFM